MVLSHNKCFNNSKTTQFLSVSHHGPPTRALPWTHYVGEGCSQRPTTPPAAMARLQSGKKSLTFSLSRISILNKSWQVWYLSLRKLRNRLRRFPEIPIHSSLYGRPSCHTLPNAFEISKKFPRNSSDVL